MKKVLFAATTALLLSVSSAAMAADAADKFVGQWVEDAGIGSQTLVISKVSPKEVHIKRSSRYGGNDTIDLIVDGDNLLYLSKYVDLTLVAPNVLKGDGSEYFKQ